VDAVDNPGWSPPSRSGDIELNGLLSNARTAEDRGQISEAHELYTFVSKVQQDCPDGHIGLSRVLDAFGQEMEADKVLENGLEQVLKDHALLAYYAEFASKRHDWAKASIRWRTYRMQYSSHPIGYVRRIGAVRTQQI
jgi:hypothetical protein